MRAEVDHHFLLTSAEDHGVGESREARNDFHGSSTSIVQDAIVEGPAVDVPYPTGYRAVDKGGPEEHEDHEREHATSFGDGSSSDGGGDGTELQLIETVQEFWDQGRSRAGCAEGVDQTEVVEITDEAVGSLSGEGERITPEVPLKGDDGEGCHTGPNHAES